MIAWYQQQGASKWLCKDRLERVGAHPVRQARGAAKTSVVENIIMPFLHSKGMSCESLHDPLTTARNAHRLLLNRWRDKIDVIMSYKTLRQTERQTDNL